MQELTDLLEAQSAKSKTTKLLVDCLIKPVLIWCAFLRASRENDLALHYVASKAMLPYFLAGRGKMNTKYATFHVHHLEVLPKEVMRQLQHDFSLRVREGIFNFQWNSHRSVHRNNVYATGPWSRGSKRSYHQPETDGSLGIKFCHDWRIGKKPNGYDSRSVR